MAKKIKTHLKFDANEKKNFLLSNFNAKNRRKEKGRKYAEKMIEKEHKKELRKINKNKQRTYHDFRGKFLQIKDAIKFQGEPKTEQSGQIQSKENSNLEFSIKFH